MREEYEFYDRISLRSDGLVINKVCVNSQRSYNVCEKSKDNLKNNKVKGKLSPTSKRLLRKILDNWITSIYYYRWKRHITYNNNLPFISAITLTLPNCNNKDDYFVKKNMLSVFFTTLVRYHKVRLYFWKAEKQKNGTIHFHVLIDRFVHYQYINEIWNGILFRNGLLKEYIEKYGNQSPPSTRIEKIRSKTKAISYLIKYALKDDEHGMVEGRVYGMSDELRKIRNLALMVSYEIATSLNYFGIDKTKCIIKEKYYSYFKYDLYNLTKNKHDILSYYYQSYLSYLYSSLYEDGLFSYQEFHEIYDTQNIVD